MNIGIACVVPNDYGTYLHQLLKPVPLEHYMWRNNRDEIYKIEQGTLGEDLFTPEQYMIDGALFQKQLALEQYVIFANFAAYPLGNTYDETMDIEDYNEYVESDCQLYVIIIDSSFVLIYCKDAQLTKALYENARFHQFKNVEYITKENDTQQQFNP